jgi:hypothetical protein
MPSRALRHWQTRGRKVLDEFEAAHALVDGTPAARRFARQQIAQAYVVLLCSQFQKFCRDLHSEATDYLVRQPAFSSLGPLLLATLNTGRRLDVGNPNPSNLGADFSKFGFPFWSRVHQFDARNIERQRRLEELNRWRNAIAHQDFSNPVLGGRDAVNLAEVRRWRRTCDALAVDFDRVVSLYLKTLTGVRSW